MRNSYTRARRGRLAGATVAVVLVAMAGACGGEAPGGGESVSGDESSGVGSLRVLTPNESRDGGDDARVMGEIAAVGDCVGLVHDGLTRLVFWPRGTESDSSQRVLYDNEAFGLGDDLDASGGYLSPVPADFADIPESCVAASDTPNEVVILN